MVHDILEKEEVSRSQDLLGCCPSPCTGPSRERTGRETCRWRIQAQGHTQSLIFAREPGLSEDVEIEIHTDSYSSSFSA